MQERRTIALLLKCAALPVLLVLWGVVGFLLWAPLVLQATFVFSGVHIRSTLYGGTVADASRAFDRILMLWITGFITLVHGLFTPSVLDDSQPPRAVGGSWWKLLGQCVASLVVWTLIFVLLKIIAPGHVNLDGVIDWVVSLPDTVRMRLGH